MNKNKSLRSRHWGNTIMLFCSVWLSKLCSERSFSLTMMPWQTDGSIWKVSQLVTRLQICKILTKLADCPSVLIMGCSFHICSMAPPACLCCTSVRGSLRRVTVYRQWQKRHEVDWWQLWQLEAKEHSGKPVFSKPLSLSAHVLFWSSSLFVSQFFTYDNFPTQHFPSPYFSSPPIGNDNDQCPEDLIWSVCARLQRQPDFVPQCNRGLI